MKKSHKISIIGSILFAIIVITGAVIVSNNRRGEPSIVANAVQRSVSKTELAKADGKQGRNCYVAVDGTVYQIKDFSLWQDGKHTSSQGLAYCGADLSKVIDRAPHGRKILDILIKIGPLR